MPGITPTLVPFHGQMVNFHTPVLIDEVLSRLNTEVNKAGSVGVLLPFMSTTHPKDEFIAGIENITQGRDFAYFLEYNHHTWLRSFNPDTPRTVVYTIGNPLIAETMLRYDLSVAYHVPPRVLIQEKRDGKGTCVSYQQPSSVMVFEDIPELVHATKVLDGKLADLISRVVQVL